jgi:cytochrome P450
MAGIRDGILLEHFRTGMGGTTGPEHARLRRAAASYFSPKGVERLRATCRAIIDELLEPVASGDTVDFRVIADELPARVFLAMIDMPASDSAFLARVSGSIVKVFEAETEGSAAEIRGAYDELMTYSSDLIDLRTPNLGDDLVSALIQSDAELTRDEIMNMLAMLLSGSVDNSSMQMCLMIDGLSTRPEVWQQFRSDTTNVRDMVSECMRMFPRQVRNAGPVPEAFVWDGVEIPEGVMLMGNVAAGYRDPAVYPDPDRFDASREQRSALNFGSGTHICLGAHLARMEFEEVLLALAERFSSFEVAHIHQDSHHYHDALDEFEVVFRA